MCFVQAKKASQLLVNFSSLKNSKIFGLFFKTTMWSLSGSVIANGASLLTSIFVARAVGKLVFGQYIVLQTVIVLGTTLFWYGIGVAVTKYCAELRLRDPKRLGRILAMTGVAVAAFSGLSVLIILVSADALATHVLKAPALAFDLRLVSIAVLFNAFDGFNKNALIGLSEMRLFALGSIYGVCLGFPLTLILTLQYGFIGAVSSLVLVALLNCLISGFQLLRALEKFEIILDFHSIADEKAILGHFAAPGFLLGLLPPLSTWLVQFFLIGGMGGYSEVAILGVSMQWFHIVNFLPSNASRSIMPMLTEAVADKDHAKSRRIFLMGIVVCIAAALPAALGGAVLAPLIVQGYGPDFSGTELALRIAMLAGVINAAQSPVQNLIAAKSEMWVAAAMAVVQAFIYVSVALYMISRGAVGVAIAFAVAYLLVSLWSLYYGWLHFYGEVRNN